MDAELCIEALQDTLTRYGVPEFSTRTRDRRPRRPVLTGFMEERQIRISMDGR